MISRVTVGELGSSGSRLLPRVPLGDNFRISLGAVCVEFQITLLGQPVVVDGFRALARSGWHVGGMVGCPGQSGLHVGVACDNIETHGLEVEVHKHEAIKGAAGFSQCTYVAVDVFGDEHVDQKLPKFPVDIDGPYADKLLVALVEYAQ